MRPQIQNMTNRERQLHIRLTRNYIGAFNFFAERMDEDEGRGFPVKYRAVDCMQDGV